MQWIFVFKEQPLHLHPIPLHLSIVNTSKHPDRFALIPFSQEIDSSRTFFFWGDAARTPDSHCTHCHLSGVCAPPLVGSRSARGWDRTLNKWLLSHEGRQHLMSLSWRLARSVSGCRAAPGQKLYTLRQPPSANCYIIKGQISLAARPYMCKWTKLIPAICDIQAVISIFRVSSCS